MHSGIVLPLNNFAATDMLKTSQLQESVYVARVSRNLCLFNHVDLSRREVDALKETMQQHGTVELERAQRLQLQARDEELVNECANCFFQETDSVEG